MNLLIGTSVEAATMSLQRAAETDTTAKQQKAAQNGAANSRLPNCFSCRQHQARNISSMILMS
jgi:cytochrome c553